MYEVMSVTDSGRTIVLGPVFNTSGFQRQTTEAARRKRYKEDMIIARRSSVRALLSMAESSMEERPKQRYLQPYWDELNEIVRSWSG
jgi:hypothetical protein